MVLSAPINNPEVASCLGGTHGGLLHLAVAKHSVIVDSDVVVGRRSRHRADVLGRRPQGPDSRRCHQRAAPCPLARVLAASSARRSAPSELFQPYALQMYILLVQRAPLITLDYLFSLSKPSGTKVSYARLLLHKRGRVPRMEHMELYT